MSRPKCERAVLVLQGSPWARFGSSGEAQYAQRADGVWFSRCTTYVGGKRVWGRWNADTDTRDWLPVGQPVEVTALVPSADYWNFLRFPRRFVNVN